MTAIHDSATACPICGQPANFSFAHPSADIFRCSACTHVYSRLDTVRELESYDASYYEDTHKRWFENPNYKLFSWIERRLPTSTGSVLDVGCGNGDFLRYVHARRPGVRLVGIDLSPESPSDAFEYLHGDVMSTEVSETFDVVTSLAVIEHVADVRAFARRIGSLCAPGGTVVIMTLNSAGILYLAAHAGRRLGVTIASDRLYDTHHLHHFTRRSLQEVLEQSGLVVDQVHHHNVPLRALDLPPTGSAARHTMMAGVAVAFGVGRLLDRCYLQTMICRRPAAALPG